MFTKRELKWIAQGFRMIAKDEDDPEVFIDLKNIELKASGTLKKSVRRREIIRDLVGSYEQTFISANALMRKHFET